ncbi:MAG: tetratricopeptide repeat protein [Deltaproteobacteria bacterium]|nr:tetratricopeptide repeat protein [Deltaproteobacteria bacterium]
MRVHCGACDQEFELPDGERLRCPNCLRRTGLNVVDPAARKRGGILSLPPAVLAIVAVAIVGVASVGIFLWARAGEPKKPGPAAWAPPAPRSDAELAAALTTAGIDKADQVAPLGQTDAVRALAKGITVTEPLQRLRAAAALVRAGLASGKLEHSEPSFMGGEPPRDAGELALLLESGQAARVSSFELALLTAAIARASGAPALIGEGLSPLVDNDAGVRGRGPALEPSGTRGVFVAARAPTSPVSAPQLVVVDGQEPPEVDVRSDELVTQIFYSQRGLARLGSDPEAAARDADLAAKIAQPSPTVASARAAIAEIVDMPETAVSIWRTAISQGGGDAPRLAALAHALLAAGDPGQAAAEARDALALDPGNASAHGALARAMASAGAVEEATRHIEEARKKAGSVRRLALAEAALEFARGDRDGARKRLDAAIDDSDPSVSAEAGLTLYELAAQEGDKVRGAEVRRRVLEASKLKTRLGLRFDEIDRAYAPPPAPPDSGVPPAGSDGGVPDSGPKYVIPDGKGTPI